MGRVAEILHHLNKSALSSHVEMERQRQSLNLLISHSLLPYSTTTRSVPLRPKTSGEYISSALAGGTMNSPGVVARAV
jgi:hypothetical protein